MRASLLLLLAAALGIRAPSPAAAAGFVDVPDAAARAERLVLQPPPASGMHFGPAELHSNEIYFPLFGPPGGRRLIVGGLHLFSHASPRYMRQASRSFTIFAEAFGHGLVSRAAVTRILIAAAEGVKSRDDGTFALVSFPQVRQGSGFAAYPWRAAGALFLALFGALLLLSGWRDLTFTFRVKLSHVLPAAIQGTLFLYWSLYWLAVRDYMPALAWQIVYAFLLDGFLSLLLRRRWDIGFGVVVIVFSINLFGWFLWPPAALAVVTFAIVSKALIRRGTGHLFNPSAVALAMGGLLYFLTRTFAFEGLFDATNLPPNMSEVVILLALLPLARFRIALMAVGGLAAMRFFRFVVPFPIDHPQMFLTVALLATDPATIPRTPAGRLAYGVFVGSGVVWTDLFLQRLGCTDEWAKVFPIPAANLLTPWFDRLADWRPLSGRWLSGDLNAWHMAAWVLFAMTIRWSGKAEHFETTLHWSCRTPMLEAGPEGIPTCRNNPLFCEVLSFPAEVRAWRARSATAF